MNYCWFKFQNPKNIFFGYHRNSLVILINPSIKFQFWASQVVHGKPLTPGWPAELPSLCCSTWCVATLCGGWQRFCCRRSRIMGDPGGKVTDPCWEKQWECGNCCVLEAELYMRTLLMSTLMFFVCVSCGDLYAYMGITSAVFRCEYAPCSGVSPS